MTITRSTGLHTGYGAYFCGNGYEGLTKELDDTVKQEAELLTTTFDRDVEIRYNSDKESGGAWLKNSLKGFDGNCQVGLGAGFHAIKPAGMSADDYYHLYKTLPKEIQVNSYVAKSALKNPEICNSGLQDSRYCWHKHKSVDEALAWLIANLDTNQIFD